ncbi:hypothetical protein D3C81_473660 [compost metagenome]
MLEAEILGAGNLADVDRRGNRTAGVEFDVGVVAVLQPHPLLAAILGDFVGRIGVIQRHRQAVDRRELHDRLPVDAFTLELGERIAKIIRPCIQLADGGRVDHRRVARHRPGPRLDVPVVLGGLCRATLALLLARAQAHAERLFRIGVAEDAREFRRQVVLERLALVGNHLGARVGDKTLVVERPRRQDVDGGTDTAAGYLRLAGLVDLDAIDGFGRQLCEVERTGTAIDAADGNLSGRTEGIRTRHLAAVERHHVELWTEATRRDLCAFTITALDRDAGDALQRFGQVGVWELADVLGTDRIDHTRGVAFDVHRLAEAVADAGDLDRIQLGRLGFTLRLLGSGRLWCRLLPECGIYDQHAPDKGEHRPGFELGQLPVHELTLMSGALRKVQALMELPSRLRSYGCIAPPRGGHGRGPSSKAERRSTPKRTAFKTG